MIDRRALLDAIRDGSLSSDHVDVANHSCRDKLEQLDWTYEQVLDCLLCIEERDFRGSEWCETNWYGWLPCDAYAIRYDEISRRRDRNGLEYYLKFSLNDDAVLNLLLVRVHL